jgi:phosphopentomutase
VVLIVMDSVGIGELPDADRYGDEGSDTLGHIHAAVPLQIPTLRSMGLAKVADIGGPVPPAVGAYGRMAEASAGKDSVTGHWEMMGLLLDLPFPTFPHGFPQPVLAEFSRRIGRPVIGNVVGSGTAIIDEFADEHIRTGAPVVYTSADSVFQIAAHESVIPIAEQYRICEAAFDLVARGMGIARVIARPFVGTAGAYVRTANRRDFALEPTGRTLLDAIRTAGHNVIAIGKIEDLFAGHGISRAIHTTSDEHGMDVLEQELRAATSGLIFVNLVDFDTKYGHRNDVAGYAENLERFDSRLRHVRRLLGPGDMLVVTADHGNDPSTPSTDHSREYVPVLVSGQAIRPDVNLGTRNTFADLGQSLAELFEVPPLAHGNSFLSGILK